MLLFLLCYIVICVICICPPSECVSAGITMDHLWLSLFPSLLPREQLQFISHHVIRSRLKVIEHAALPCIFTLIVVTKYSDHYHVVSWSVLLYLISFVSVCTACVVLYKWRGRKHPVYEQLNLYADPQLHENLINQQFRRVDKVCLQTNTTTKIIVTDDWIMKVTTYGINLCHQDDAVLIVYSSDTHILSPHNNGSEMQFINIEVKSTREKVKPFTIRINSRDFRDLQDKVTRQIVILPNIVFHKTVVDKFIEVFKRQIETNEPFVTNAELEPCLGCTEQISNVKINKQCSDFYDGDIVPEGQRLPNCMQCYCRPMWCVTCLAQWFANRQDADRTEVWLSSKCTCPVCRATFCMLDVSYVRTPDSFLFG